MSSASSSSWVAQIMQPGGGVLLLPLVRFVISLLLICTVGAAVLTDVARIHMIVLSTLAAGLLVSLQFFESELHKARRNNQGGGGGDATPAAGTTTAATSHKASSSKTD